MTKEDIERIPIEARWKLDDGFSGHLMIDEDHDLSSLVPRWRGPPEIPRSSSAMGRSLTYWVRNVPTPPQAATLLTDHGGTPAEERGKPHELNLVGG